MDRYYEQAFSLMTSSESRRVFDLSREPDALRDRYGRTRFGQSCLLARRLVESGVPFVQVNWSTHVEAEEDAGDGGWDNHYRNFEMLVDWKIQPHADSGIYLRGSPQVQIWDPYTQPTKHGSEVGSGGFYNNHGSFLV